MKKLLIIALLVVIACDEPRRILGPQFRIEGDFLTNRFETFVQLAADRGITVPQDNMILRFVDDDDATTNDSKSYMQGGVQLYIDIDESYLYRSNSQNIAHTIIFQQLAHGLLNTPWGCGIMWRMQTADDIHNRDFSDLNYEPLFDSSAPC